MLIDLWIELIVYVLFVGFSIVVSEIYIYLYFKNLVGGIVRFFVYSLWKRILVGSKLNCIIGSLFGRMNFYCFLI